jgi:hypothetical protein
MRKIILGVLAATALAAPIATATAAHASVAVDNGTGFVGKGDVQTALGYANDGAFQAAKPATAVFTVDGDRTNVSVDIKCQAANGTQRVKTLDLGYVAFNETAVTSTPKISGGKVTGYNLAGSVTEVGNHLNIVNATLACNTDETWAGYADTTPNGAWRWTPVQGTGVLQVTLGGRTVALPNTPVV